MTDLLENPRTDRESGWPDVVLHTAPGAGILVRRPTAVLFVPDPTDQIEKLLASFKSAIAGTELDGLAEAALEAGFDLPPFAAAVFDSTVTLRVFGDLQLKTDQPSTPMLSAAGSATWVDHTLHRPSDTLSIEVIGESCDPLTDAQLGSFSAGGFRLLLNGRVEFDAADHQPSPLVELVLDRLAPVSAVASEAAEHTPNTGLVEEPTLDPPADVSHAVSSSGSEGSKHEPEAHAYLRFDDGQKVEVRQPLVIGRNPVRMAEAAQIEPLVIAGEKVSRAHLMVSIEDGKLLVDDCGSRNGSAVLVNDRAEPMQLLSGTPVAVEAGAKVYLGSRSFTVLETNLEAA